MSLRPKLVLAQRGWISRAPDNGRPTGTAHGDREVTHEPQCHLQDWCIRSGDNGL